MKVFVTGATGVLGRPVVKSLIDEGHTVLAHARSENAVAALQAMGADPVTCDLFHSEQVQPHLDGCQAVLHLATSIPKTPDIKKADAWRQNDRLRTDATAALVEAATETASVKTFVYPSVCFMYSDHGSNRVDAGSAKSTPVGILHSTLDAEGSVADFDQSDASRVGVSLRFGIFYGPSSRDSADVIKFARKGLALPLAQQQAYKSMIWIDDAANAVIAALKLNDGGVYDVVEDEPLTIAQSTTALAEAVGRAKIRSLPRFMLRFLLTPELREMMGRSQRVDASRFKSLTGWAPQVPSQREGWKILQRTFEA